MYLQKLLSVYIYFIFFFRKRGKGISREYYFIRKFFFSKNANLQEVEEARIFKFKIELQGGNEV